MNEQLKKIDKIVEAMSLDDLCGQVLCYDMSTHRWSDEEFKEIAKNTLPGGIFVYNASKDEIDKYNSIINIHTKVPVIVSSDAENGPGGPLKEETIFPQPMAWGACDDAELIENAGRATAQLCRKSGIHWTFAPLADINYNKDNPSVNVRSVSDSPKQVAKIAGAYMRGVQENNLLAATAKHFPGDGVDDRNQHFCTIINSKSKEEWLDTFGYVYREMFKDGLKSVMVGHISLPAVQEDEYDSILGYKPGTLSYNVITRLLKEELGFKGCVVSDAMCMVGACSMIDPDKLAVEFLKAGGDMVLFAMPSDFYNVKQAVEDGYLSVERLRDAVRNVLILKDGVNILDGEDENIKKNIEITLSSDDIAREISEKSVCVVRNADGLFPLRLPENGKILCVNLQCDSKSVNAYPMDFLKKELEKRGHSVNVLTNPGHRPVEEELSKNYDAVLINCRISCRDCTGGTLRIAWSQIAAFWRGRILKHPNVIFTSFGDPYKIYDYPFLKTYVNTFSNSPETQRTYVRVLLGEIPASGKSPVALEGFIDKNVD